MKTMNKMCKNSKLLLVRELVFCNNPKANEKKPIVFLLREGG